MKPGFAAVGVVLSVYYIEVTPEITRESKKVLESSLFIPKLSLSFLLLSTSLKLSLLGAIYEQSLCRLLCLHSFSLPFSAGNMAH